MNIMLKLRKNSSKVYANQDHCVSEYTDIEYTLIRHACINFSLIMQYIEIFTLMGDLYHRVRSIPGAGCIKGV